MNMGGPNMNMGGPNMNMGGPNQMGGAGPMNRMAEFPGGQQPGGFNGGPQELLMQVNYFLFGKTYPFQCCQIFLCGLPF